MAILANNGPRRIGAVKNATKSTESARRLTPDDPEQYKRFLEAAKKAQADETKEGADKAFKKVTSSLAAKKAK
jgi:hypothetical protein